MKESLTAAELVAEHTLVPVLTIFGIVFIELWLLKRMWKYFFRQNETAK